MKQKIRKKQKSGVLLIFLLLLILGSIAGVRLYLNDYYRADRQVFQILSDEYEDYTVEESEEHRIIFQPEGASRGLIFYPGGKVAYEAYLPLMKACADRGIFCVLAQMPGNLAILDINAAEEVRKSYPEISEWYIGGHSLGGAMAASFIGKHIEEYQGLILLAAYSTSDLTESGLKVLSVYGTEDQILNKEKYEKCRNNLPGNSVELVIQGGCHSWFGSYGLQSGDGEPVITAEEQIFQTAEAIEKLLNSQ